MSARGYWLREMRPEDIPAVEELCRRQNERDGTSYGVPQVFRWDEETEQLLPNANAPLALVTVGPAGDVVAGHVFERTVEYMGFGLDGRATLASMNEAPAVFWRLRELEFASLHILAPKLRANRMAVALRKRMGMRRDDNELAHFYREL